MQQKMYYPKRKNPMANKQNNETQECFQNQNDLVVYDQFVQDIVKCFQEQRNPQLYVFSQEQKNKLKNNLISNCIIIYGPGDSGKTSSIFWAIHQQKEVQAIIINCELYSTQSQFIKKMIQQIGSRVNQKNMKTSLVIKQAIKFEELNEFIIKSGKKFVFVIKCCQKLVIYKKQIILYNLCQWMKTQINSYIGVVFLSKKFDFTQKLQKRVKSRMSAKTITLFKPDGYKILQIFKKRLIMLKNQYQKVQETNKSQKKKITNKYLNTSKMNFLEKLQKAILENKEFRCQLQDNYWRLNNQYLQCLKLVLIKDLVCSDFLEQTQKDFNSLFFKKFSQIRECIFPNYYENIILQCGIPQLILLAIVANIGINKRGVLKLSQIYKWYLEFQKRQPIIVTFFGKDPQSILERNLQKLIDKRLFELQKKDFIWQCQIFLALTPTDIAQILKQNEKMETFIGGIVDL